MKDKIFYKFIVKHFKQQLHDYLISRIPSERYGAGSKIPLNKRVYAEDCWSVDKNGVLRGKTTTKHYIKGWNDCAEEMKARCF
jgi:hypothetical protein